MHYLSFCCTIEDAVVFFLPDTFAIFFAIILFLTLNILVYLSVAIIADKQMYYIEYK